MADAHLTDPMTVGVAQVARHLGVWFIDVENVAQAASLNDGETIVALKKSLESEWVHTPVVEESPDGIELFHAEQHGAPAFRSRLGFHGEAFWVEAFIGRCWLLPVPEVPFGQLGDVLEPSDQVPADCVLPSRFSPPPGTTQGADGLWLAGYLGVRAC